MSKANTWENNVLALLFNNTTLAGYGDVTGLVGSSGAGSLYVSLHTADPGEAGNQTTSEIAYTSYARIAVARTAGGWTVSGTAPTMVQNTAIITFPDCTGSSGVATHFGIGTASIGAGKLLYSGAFVSSLSITSGVRPTIDPANITITED